MICLSKGSRTAGGPVSPRGARLRWSVNHLAQIAGIAALRDGGYILAAKREISFARAFLYGRLRSIPELKVYPSAANFLLIKLLDRKWDSIRLSRALARRGILIRDCSSFEPLGRSFIRIAVRRLR